MLSLLLWWTLAKSRATCFIEKSWVPRVKTRSSGTMEYHSIMQDEIPRCAQIWVENSPQSPCPCSSCQRASRCRSCLQELPCCSEPALPQVLVGLVVCYSHFKIGVSTNAGTQNGWLRGNPTKMDDLAVPRFKMNSETLRNSLEVGGKVTQGVGELYHWHRCGPDNQPTRTKERTPWTHLFPSTGVVQSNTQKGDGCGHAKHLDMPWIHLTTYLRVKYHEFQNVWPRFPPNFPLTGSVSRHDVFYCHEGHPMDGPRDKSFLHRRFFLCIWAVSALQPPRKQYFCANTACK